MMEASVIFCVCAVLAMNEVRFRGQLSVWKPPSFGISVSVRSVGGKSKVVDTHLRARSGNRTVDLPHVRCYEESRRDLSLWSSLVLLPPEEWSVELFLELRDGSLVEVELELPLYMKSNRFRGAGPLGERELELLDLAAREAGDYANYYRLGQLRGIQPVDIVDRKFRWELRKGNFVEALVCFLAVEVCGGVGTRAPIPNLEQILFCAPPEEAMSLIPRVVELARQIAPEKEGRPHVRRFSETGRREVVLDYAEETRRFIGLLYKGKPPVEHLSERASSNLKGYGMELALWAGAPDHMRTTDGRLARAVAVEILERETGVETPPGLTPQETGVFWEEQISERFEFFAPAARGGYSGEWKRLRAARLSGENRGWLRGFALGLGTGVALAVLCYLGVRLLRRARPSRQVALPGSQASP